MAHKLEKPYTEQQRIDFIVNYNHIQALRIEETELAIYALEAWELLEGDEVIDNTEAWEEEQAQKERERIAKLYLTGADVERGIYQAKGMDFDDIVAMVTQLQPEGIDIKALKIELKANNFYRGNPYVSAIGGLLGFTIGQLDKFFEFNDYTYLIPEPVVDNPEDIEEENPVVDDILDGEDIDNLEE